MKKLLFLFIILNLIFYINTKSEPITKEWTIMVFLNGDNDLESAGIRDVNEMEQVGSDENINIVVQFDRSHGHDKSNSNWTDTRRFYITKDNNKNIINSEVIENCGEIDMGNWEEAYNFFDWSVSKYPAKKYMFIYWNHGSGWMKEATIKGISFDDTSGNHINSFGMKKAAEKMYAKIGRKIDVLAFDACLMAMIEVAYQHNDFFNYMIGSEETEPGNGWPYNIFLKKLSNNHDMPVTELLGLIAKDYIEYYKKTSDSWNPLPVTQSVIDLSKIDPIIEELTYLSELIYEDIDTNFEKTYEDMNYRVRNYYLDYYIDMYDMFSKISDRTESKKIKASCNRIKESIKQAVLYNYYSDNRNNSHGLSIYVPTCKQDWHSKYLLTDLGKDTLWDETMEKYKTLNTNTNSYVPPAYDPGFGGNDPLFGDEDLWYKIKRLKNITKSEKEYYIQNIASLVSMEYKKGNKTIIEDLKKMSKTDKNINLILEKIELF